MPNAPTGPRPAIPRSARSPSIGARACSCAWEMRQRGAGGDAAAAARRAERAAHGPRARARAVSPGELTLLAHDTAGARATWLALEREDSIGYYGLRARREIDLPPLRITAAPLPG